MKLYRVVFTRIGIPNNYKNTVFSSYLKPVADFVCWYLNMLKTDEPYTWYDAE